MKLRIASDLHLEAYLTRAVEKNGERFLPHDPRDAESVLILAGDICSRLYPLVDFLEYCETRFKNVIYVPGNHEYYKYDMHQWNDAATELFEQKLSKTLASATYKTFVLEGIRFHIGTAWGDGQNYDRHVWIEEYLNDFRLIEYHGRKFKAQDMVKINEQFMRNLKLGLMYFSEPNVVVTHHMPSYALCHPRFSGVANGGFAFNADSIMFDESIAPKLWIAGHTHDTIDDVIGHTRVVINPAGYKSEYDTKYNTFFSEPKFVDV